MIDVYYMNELKSSFTKVKKTEIFISSIVLDIIGNQELAAVSRLT